MDITGIAMDQMGNEIDAIILEFSQQQPTWQQDLFRRVLTQQSCTQSDLDEVLLLLKAEMGIGIASPPDPLCADHVRFREPSSSTTILSSLSETKNVNRLMADQELPFGANGITLIYGDNGSGKSGYCRILRQLCRARRERPEKVLGDVYASSSPAEAQAKLFYSVGGELKEHNWIDGSPAPKELSRLTLFDAQAAPIYVDKQNQIEFLPDGLDVLPNVGSALQAIGDMIEREISALAGTIQYAVITVGADTSVGALVKGLEITNLASLPSVEEIQTAGQWCTNDDMTLANVRDALTTMAEPIKAAAKYRRMRGALARISSSIRNAIELLDDKALDELVRIRTEAQSAREATRVAASDAFQEDPLGAHVSTEAWRNLFQYAREFSDVVYPGQSFPVVGGDSKCVLCQQPLSESASVRMTRFHSFITEAASRDAERHEHNVLARLKAIKELGIASVTDVKSDLGEYSGLGSQEGELVDAVSNLCLALRERQVHVIEPSKAQGQPQQLPTLAVEALTEAVKVLETKALDYEQTATNQSQMAHHAKQRDELEARRLLSSELARVLERREVLENLRSLRRCRTACDTTAVSRKASSLREAHVSGGFQERLTSEVKRLGIDYLPLKVASKSEHGASFLGIALDQTAGARTAAVLSEGEFRVLAVACFLAEVGGISGHDGIIVDDPVSSLDHRHIRQVARRLVNEASARPQVIIFTHSLPFYYELLEAAQEAVVPVETHWVRRTSVKNCGKVDVNDAPWQVKKVKERLAVLETNLKEVPKPTDCADEDYIRHVKAFYGLLRETWERLVEERLLNGVVGRFEPGVKTQSLKGVIVEDVDYQRIFSAMAKASRYSGHDGAISLQTSMPDVAEMRHDVDLLKNYEQELRKRANQAEARRKALEDPVKVKTA